MWTLFGSDGSGSAAVEMALLRCAVPYRLVRASTWEDDSAQSELRQANPLGQIPTLQFDDGSVMTESAAILAELGLRFPQARLLPREDRARAQALRGLAFVAANCYAAIGIIDYPERWIGDADPAELQRLQQGARTRLHHYWEVFADVFAAPGARQSDFLDGDQPGALDLLAAVVSRWSGARAHLQSHRPDVAALLKRVENQPDLAPVFARHWPA